MSPAFCFLERKSAACCCCCWAPLQGAKGGVIKGASKKEIRLASRSTVLKERSAWEWALYKCIKKIRIRATPQVRSTVGQSPEYLERRERKIDKALVVPLFLSFVPQFSFKTTRKMSRPRSSASFMFTRMFYVSEVIRRPRRRRFVVGTQPRVRLSFTHFPFSLTLSRLL